jgi:hypothetical protein
VICGVAGDFKMHRFFARQKITFGNDALHWMRGIAKESNRQKVKKQ